MKGLKGVSLAVNTIIIIALGVLVLLAIALWFARSPTTITDEQVGWTKACTQWKTYDCRETPDFYSTVRGVDLNGDGRDDTIQEICGVVHSTTNYEECRDICCGKPINISTTTCSEWCTSHGYKSGSCVVGECEGFNPSLKFDCKDYETCCCTYYGCEEVRGTCESECEAPNHPYDGEYQVHCDEDKICCVSS